MVLINKGACTGIHLLYNHSCNVMATSPVPMVVRESESDGYKKRALDSPAIERKVRENVPMLPNKMTVFGGTEGVRVLGERVGVVFISECLQCNRTLRD